MEMNFFFKFGSKLLPSTFQVSALGLGYDKNEVDDELNLIKGIYEGIDFPVSFKQTSGKKLTDILDTGWAGLFLISDNLKTILEQNCLTGWKTFPIKIYDKNENEINGYHGFSVTGNCGPISFKNSKVIEKKLVPNGPLCEFYLGLSIGLDKWERNDFFTATNSYGTIITKKAADILQKNKISNMRLSNLAEVETSIRAAKYYE